MAAAFQSAKEMAKSTFTPDCLKAKVEEVQEFAKSKTAAGQEGFDPSDPANKGKITEWEAAWNVTNAIQGMFIVSLPYGVYHGGYWAMLAMVGIAHICCHTGKILVECLYEKDDEGKKVKVRSRYEGESFRSGNFRPALFFKQFFKGSEEGSIYY